MFKWIKNTFFNDSSPDIVGTISSGIDALHLSEEEKQDYNLKALEGLTKYHQATKHQSLSRRFIAFAVMGNFLLFLFVALICIIFELDSRFDKIIVLLEDFLLTPSAVILGFYFLSPITRGIK